MASRRRSFAERLGLAAVALGIALPHAAAEFPERPVDVVVPFAAGGGSDTFVRILQKAIRENDLSPQPFVVRNAGGAGGTIGSRRARDAKPDGHTILCLHDGIYTAQHYGTAEWGPADFEPIAATGRSGVVVAVAEDSPYENLAELMADAKERPYRVVCGTNLGAGESGDCGGPGIRMAPRARRAWPSRSRPASSTCGKRAR